MAVVLTVLAAVVVAALTSSASDAGRLGMGDDATFSGVLQAASLLFFAFAGYARIATLGEEVRIPERTIPRGILSALGDLGGRGTGCRRRGLRGASSDGGTCITPFGTLLLAGPRTRSPPRPPRSTALASMPHRTRRQAPDQPRKQRCGSIRLAFVWRSLGAYVGPTLGFSILP